MPNYKLIFRKYSETWEGEVAFIKESEDVSDIIVTRSWKVTYGQYKCIKYQEGEKWYDRQIPLGYLFGDGIPVYTITNSAPAEMIRTNPSVDYIKTIIKGLKEYPEVMHDQEIISYLTKWECGFDVGILGDILQTNLNNY